MNESMGHGEGRSDSALKAGIARRLLQVIFTVVFQAALLFLSSGDVRWVWAWVFIGLYVLGISINGTIMLRYSPETIAERASYKWAKGWDKVVAGFWALLYLALLPLTAGLDTRFGWTGSLAIAYHTAGGVAFVLGWALLSWAMVSNVYFATVVRIQKERGHTVCTTGPYHFVRHPGYVGMIVQSLAAPLMLGSLWALIPGGAAASLMVVRTSLEDQTLHEELDGYRDYAQRVRYRLVPGIW